MHLLLPQRSISLSYRSRVSFTKFARIGGEHRQNHGADRFSTPGPHTSDIASNTLLAFLIQGLSLHAKTAESAE